MSYEISVKKEDIDLFNSSRGRFLAGALSDKTTSNELLMVGIFF